MNVATARARRLTGIRYRQRSCGDCGRKGDAFHKIKHTNACLLASWTRKLEAFRAQGDMPEHVAECERQVAAAAKAIEAGEV